MLSDKRWSLARGVGIAVAHSHFVSMLNPKYRGHGFVWDNLYRIVDGFARTHIGLSGVFGKDQKAMEAESADAARYTLDICFKESEVQIWLPLRDEDPSTRLDNQLTALLQQYSLQSLLESLRRIATRQCEALKDAPTGLSSLPKSKWEKALEILVRADQALFGQHCGDVHPIEPSHDWAGNPLPRNDDIP